MAITSLGGRYIFNITCNWNALTNEEKIQELIKLVNQSIELYKDVSVILELLKDYEIVNYIKDVINTYPYIYVPLGYKSYRKLDPEGKIFITHNDPDMYITEQKLDLLLDRYAHKDIFKNKKVIFLDIDFETGGLLQYIFTSSIEKCYGYISNYKKCIYFPDPEIQKYIELLMAFWEDKTKHINFKNCNSQFIVQLIKDYYNINKSDVIRFIYHIYKKILQIKFDFSYGMNPDFYLKLPSLKDYYSFIDSWPIRTNGKYITSPPKEGKITSRKILLNGNFSVYIVISEESYVFIKKKPYKSLKKLCFYLPHVHTQFLLNSSHICFNFQDSTHITIQAINDGLYYAILDKYVNDEITYPDSIIPNSTSRLNPQDLKFSISKDIFISYLPENEDITLAEKLNSKDISSPVVKKWLSNKCNKYVISDTITQITAHHLSSFQLFVNLYLQILTEELALPPLRPPKLMVALLPPHVKGYYDRLENIICLNGDTSTFSDIYSLLSPHLPLTPLLHELLHVIQQEDHITSSHGFTSLSGKYLSFDDTALALYHITLKKEILIKFFSS